MRLLFAAIMRAMLALSRVTRSIRTIGSPTSATRRLQWCTISVLVLATGPACAGHNGDQATFHQNSTPSATSSPAGTRPEGALSSSTKVVHYVPSQRPNGSLNGECFARSLAAPSRADGWRCMFGDTIQDPCFTITEGYAECGMNPAKGEPGFVLTLTRPAVTSAPPPSSPTTPAAGWLLLLADGGICRPDTGATGSVEGKRANYTCSDGRWILGDLVPGSTWMADVVLFQPGTFTPATREQVGVAEVWQ